MAPVALPELPDVSKSRKPRIPEAKTAARLNGKGRIETQADMEWIAQLDAAAQAQGLSRSAYIRLACNRMMRTDRQEATE